MNTYRAKKTHGISILRPYCKAPFRYRQTNIDTTESQNRYPPVTIKQRLSPSSSIPRPSFRPGPQVQYSALLAGTSQLSALSSHRSNLKSQLSALLPHNISAEIPPDVQLGPILLIFNDETLFVRQVQQTDEAVTRADVGHLLLRIDRLEVIDDVCELEDCVLVL